jgi:V/A-type H+-transporting ATPase subunit C
MKSLGRYATANAVARTMLSELLTKDDFDNIVRAESINGAWLALRKTSYGKWVPEDVPGHILDIEKILREVSAARFRKSTLALRDRPRQVGNLLLARWDLDNLEAALRIWHGKDASLQRFLTHPSWVNDVAVYDIVDAETLEEVALTLRNTPYFEPVSSSIKTYREKQSIFFVEIALERDYYARLLKAVKALGGADARQAEKIVSSEIDMLNLSWLARLLAYYEVQPSGLHEYMIPGPSEISRRLSDPMLTGEGLRRLQADFTGDRLARPEGASQIDTISFLEGIVREMAVDTARHALTGYPFNIGCVFAFFLLKRVELRNLATVFAGKFAAASDDSIAGWLLGMR